MKENNTKKRRNTMRQFIDTAYKIVQEEPYDSISVRGLAKETHYNSSTLYYYFENIEHLMTYVSVKYLSGFFSEQRYIEQNHINSIDRFLKTWKALIKYGFRYPDQYYMLFYGDYSNRLTEVLQTFENLYTNELTPLTKSFPLIKSEDGSTNMPILDLCIAHGHIKAQSREKLIELIDMLFKSMLLKAKEEKEAKAIIDMEKRMMEYMRLFLKSYQTPIGMSLIL